MSRPKASLKWIAKSLIRLGKCPIDLSHLCMSARVSLLVLSCGGLYEGFLTNNESVFPIYEPQHVISNNVICATSKGSDQPAHTRSLIRAFASPLNII